MRLPHFLPIQPSFRSGKQRWATKDKFGTHLDILLPDADLV